MLSGLSAEVTVWVVRCLFHSIVFGFVRGDDGFRLSMPWMPARSRVNHAAACSQLASRALRES